MSTIKINPSSIQLFRQAHIRFNSINPGESSESLHDELYKLILNEGIYPVLDKEPNKALPIVREIESVIAEGSPIGDSAEREIDQKSILGTIINYADYILRKAISTSHEIEVLARIANPTKGNPREAALRYHLEHCQFALQLYESVGAAHELGGINKTLDISQGISNVKLQMQSIENGLESLRLERNKVIPTTSTLNRSTTYIPPNRHIAG